MKFLRRKGAFTLVELLVVVAIIAVLLAIALPSLGRVMGSSAEVKSLSNVRQLAIVVQMYADGSDGFYPATEDGALYPASDGYQASYPYWQIARTWTGVVWDLLPYDSNEEIYLSPRSRRLGVAGARYPTSYTFSTSFVGQPDLWESDSQPAVALRRPVRVSRVRYPSSKGMLWDIDLSYLPKPPRTVGQSVDESSAMAMADGSAAAKNPADAVLPIQNPFDHGLDEAPVHNTPSGVLGRDY